MLQDFGPYSIVKKMAVGGMAEIYLARERGLEGLERTVVLKRILPTYSDHPEFVTMFLDEARLLAALSHPNIAQVFGLGKIEDAFYLVMEYVRGTTLGGLLGGAAQRGERGLPRHIALGVALSIAEALHYVHERRDELGRPLGIVHRDLNPANVMVSYDGAVKLIDFGIAKAATKVYETRTGVIKGTYGYMAPEQLTRKRQVDHRADVFALGVLLYEMCLGTHPFDASSEGNIIDRLLNASYKRPREIDRNFPKDLDRLIAGSLSVHPEARPEDMRVVIDALVAHLAHVGAVPTMSGLAAVARDLVPDVEGPVPVKPLRTSQLVRAFGDEPSRTGTQPKARRPSQAPPAPDLGSLLGAEETLEVHAHETTEEPPSHDAPNTSVDFGHDHIDDYDTEPPTSMTALPAQPLGPSRDMTDAVKRVRPRRRRSGLERVLLVLASGVLVLGVGVAAFMTARAISGSVQQRQEEPVLASREPSDAAVQELDAGPPEIRMLTITSEPAGATIFLDGEEASLATPATVPVPVGRDRVLVRTVLTGHATEERFILATAGQARFVLTRLAFDAGAPDAGVDASAAPLRKNRRIRRRRR